MSTTGSLRIPTGSLWDQDGPWDIYLDIPDEDITASEVFLFHRTFVFRKPGAFMGHLADKTWFIKTTGWLHVPVLTNGKTPHTVTFIQDSGRDLTIVYDWVADVTKHAVT